MPRIARVVAVGLPHHVTQRGNNQQEVFKGESDKAIYLSWMQEYSTKYDLSILVYCLMPNHVHFIVVPKTKESLAKTMDAVHTRYSQFFNRKESRTGHLWQSRYYSCVLDESHLIAAAQYVELNPVRAKLVNKPWKWKWSSARAHIGKGHSMIKLGDLFEYMEILPSSWRKYIEIIEDVQTLKKIRDHTISGRPLGNEKFIEKLEKKFNKKFRVKPKGRPWGSII